MPNPANHDSGTHTTAGATEEQVTEANVAGTFVAKLSLQNMVDGDSFRIRAYHILLASGTTQVIDDRTLNDAQPSGALHYMSPPIPNTNTDTDSVKVTIQRLSATNRAFPFELFKYT